jgi:hypothetical protein
MLGVFAEFETNLRREREMDRDRDIGRILDKMGDGQVPKVEAPPRWPINGVPHPDQPERVRIRVDMERWTSQALKLSDDAPVPDPAMVQAFARLERSTR